VKYPRLEFTSGQLLLVLPDAADPGAILEKHRRWIDRKRAFIAECRREAANRSLVRRSESRFRGLVAEFVDRASRGLEVPPPRVRVQALRTKWASMSRRGTLTINRDLRSLPDRLVDYVIFHEMAHRIEARHNERFWMIVGRRFENPEDLERDLFVYWFRIGGDGWEGRAVGREGGGRGTV
jgi:hypothetical protein